jgi:hypothetical protein
MDALAASADISALSRNLALVAANSPRTHHAASTVTQTAAPPAAAQSPR